MRPEIRAYMRDLNNRKEADTRYLNALLTAACIVLAVMLSVLIWGSVFGLAFVKGAN